MDWLKVQYPAVKILALNPESSGPTSACSGLQHSGQRHRELAAHCLNRLRTTVIAPRRLIRRSRQDFIGFRHFSMRTLKSRPTANLLSPSR